MENILSIEIDGEIFRYINNTCLHQYLSSSHKIQADGRESPLCANEYSKDISSMP